MKVRGLWLLNMSVTVSRTPRGYRGRGRPRRKKGQKSTQSAKGARSDVVNGGDHQGEHQRREHNLFLKAAENKKSRNVAGLTSIPTSSMIPPVQFVMMWIEVDCAHDRRTIWRLKWFLRWRNIMECSTTTGSRSGICPSPNTSAKPWRYNIYFLSSAVWCEYKVDMSAVSEGVG